MMHVRLHILNASGAFDPVASLIEDEFAKSTKTIREQLKRTLAHELHHCMRWRNPGWAGYTLGFDLVKKYLAKHPAESVASLVDKPADMLEKT